MKIDEFLKFLKFLEKVKNFDNVEVFFSKLEK
jgi:hypothetical protein